jgi:hypothetical protein
MSEEREQERNRHCHDACEAEVVHEEALPINHEASVD